MIKFLVDFLSQPTVVLGLVAMIDRHEKQRIRRYFRNL